MYLYVIVGLQNSIVTIYLAPVFMWWSEKVYVALGLQNAIYEPKSDNVRGAFGK